MAKSTRNYFLDIWRILFTFCIATYHLKNAFGQETSLYIAVEFFFVISGYLLVSKYESNPNKDTALSYTLGRIKKLYPHALFSYLAIFVVINGLATYNGKLALKGWIFNFIDHVPEMLLIWPLGLDKSRSWAYSAAPWYLGVMFVVGYFIYWMVKNHKKLYVEFLAPILTILVYAYFYRSLGGMHHSYTNVLFVSDYVLRGFADMNVGVMTYYLINREKNENCNKCNCNGFRVLLATLCYGITLYIGAKTGRNEYDFIKLGLIVIGTYSVLKSNINVPNALGKFISFMSELCFPIYMNHPLIRSVFGKVFDTLDYKVYALYFVVVIVYSIITMYFVKFVTKLVFKEKKNEKN